MWPSIPDGAPERRLLSEPNVLKPGAAEHVGDLLAGETLLQAGAEAVECVGSHRVKAVVSVTAQWQVTDVDAFPLSSSGGPRER